MGRRVFHDQVLWDVGNLESDPEGFAVSVCEELGAEDAEAPVRDGVGWGGMGCMFADCVCYECVSLETYESLLYESV